MGGGLLLLCVSVALLPSSVADCGRQVSAALPSFTQGLVALGEFPWVVSLRDLHNQHLAFGAILSKDWILSVASSFQDRRQALALVGVTGPTRHSLLAISAIIPHEAFDEITLTHNMALLRTAAPLVFSQTVQPICLPLQAPPAAALGSCYIAGWLSPQAGGDALRKLSLVDVDPCPLHRLVTTECASHRDGGDVPGCLGDPGNPIMCQVLDAGQWVLKGMLSKGGTRCYGPFLYTRVSYYSDWIVATTAKQGTPVAPVLVGRPVAAFRPATEASAAAGAAAPWLEARALNLSDASQGPHLLQQAEQQPQQGGKEEPPEEPAQPQGKTLPIYYDYYSGEVMPLSAAAAAAAAAAEFGQPQGGRGSVSASLSLPLLTCCWVMS